jgi:hypothetical protein
MVKRLLFLVMLLSGSISLSFAQANSDMDFINETGNAMLEQWDEDAYRNVVNLLDQLMQYDTEGISQWIAESLPSFKTVVTEPHHGISDGYVLMLRAANLTGHFNAVNGKWVKESAADDLQFSFVDQNGAPCVYRLYTAGATKTVYMPYEADEDDEDWPGYDDEEDEFGNEIIDDELEGVTLLALEVPEHLLSTLTQGGKQLMSSTFDFDLSVLTEDWNPLVNGFIVSMNTSFAKSNSGNGVFELGLNNVGYKPGTGINFSFYAKNQGNQIFSLNLNAPGTINLGDEDFDNIGIESINFNADMMGRIQAKVAVDDLNSLSAVMDGLYDAEDEEEAGYFANQVSQLVNGNLYYNGGSTSKAKLGFEPYYDDYDMEWSLYPTITFASDNSTYLLSEYFTEENFPFVSEFMGIFGELMGILNTMGDNLDNIGEDVLAIENLPNTPDLSGNVGGKAEIYTVSGRFCGRTTVEASKAVVSSLPNGVYIVKTTAGTKKFINK